MTQPERSTLQFLGYDVPLLSFLLRDVSVAPEDGGTVRYTPRFTRDIGRKEDGTHIVSISVTVGDEEDSLPFSASVKLNGYFSIEGVDEPRTFLEVNATAILFPYLRATLSSLTTLANIPQFVLPTFNIVEMFKSQEKH